MIIYCLQLINQTKQFIYLRIKHIHIRNLGIRIQPPQIRLEQTIRQRLRPRVVPVRKVRVRVYHKRAPVIRQKLQYRIQILQQVRVERARRRRVRGGHDGHGVDRGYPDPGIGWKGALEIPHGGEEVGGEGGVAGVEDLVADGDDGDGGGGGVGGEPLGGGGGGGGEVGDVGVGGADDDGDVGGGEGGDDGGVGAVEAEAGEGGGLQEGGGGGGRREVVGELAVVYADAGLGEYCGG